MGKYRIKYDYATGNSFNNYPHNVDYLELEWDNLDVAKANLIRIRDHYKYTIHNSNKSKETLKARETDWFVPDSDYSIKLYTDNGNVWQIRPPWMGYFERLNSAEIEINNDDMKIEF